LNKPCSGFLLLVAFRFDVEGPAAAPVAVFESSVFFDEEAVLDISGSAIIAPRRRALLACGVVVVGFSFTLGRFDLREEG
jgi:hypothetical protein